MGIVYGIVALLACVVAPITIAAVAIFAWSFRASASRFTFLVGLASGLAISGICVVLAGLSWIEATKPEELGGGTIGAAATLSVLGFVGLMLCAWSWHRRLARKDVRRPISTQ